jgi:hypothetical protein
MRRHRSERRRSAAGPRRAAPRATRATSDSGRAATAGTRYRSALHDSARGCRRSRPRVCRARHDRRRTGPRHARRPSAARTRRSGEALGARVTRAGARGAPCRMRARRRRRPIRSRCRTARRNRPTVRAAPRYGCPAARAAARHPRRSTVSRLRRHQAPSCGAATDGRCAGSPNRSCERPSADHDRRPHAAARASRRGSGGRHRGEDARRRHCDRVIASSCWKERRPSQQRLVGRSLFGLRALERGERGHDRALDGRFDDLGDPPSGPRRHCGVAIHEAIAPRLAATLLLLPRCDSDGARARTDGGPQTAMSCACRSSPLDGRSLSRVP